MKLVHYNPFNRLISFEDEIRNFFGEGLIGKYETDSVWKPSVDILDNEDSYLVKAELPGVIKKDVNISVNDGVLTLSGEKKRDIEKKEDNYHLTESFYGKFERSFTLPKDVKSEGIKADYKNGILNINIPKAEKAKPKEIAIT